MELRGLRTKDVSSSWQMYGGKYILQVLSYQSLAHPFSKICEKKLLCLAFVRGETASLRENYKELALISLLYLGGSLSSPVPIYAPVAHQHARWMSKIIYTIKIALF